MTYVCGSAGDHELEDETGLERYEKFSRKLMDVLRANGTSEAECAEIVISQTFQIAEKCLLAREAGNATSKEASEAAQASLLKLARGYDRWETKVLPTGMVARCRVAMPPNLAAAKLLLSTSQPEKEDRADLLVATLAEALMDKKRGEGSQPEDIGG